MKNNLTNIWRKIFFYDKKISPPVSELTYWPVWIWSEEKRIMVPVWDQNILRFYSFISVHIPAKIKEKLNMRFHIMYRVMKGWDFRFSNLINFCVQKLAIFKSLCTVCVYLVLALFLQLYNCFILSQSEKQDGGKLLSLTLSFCVLLSEAWK